MRYRDELYFDISESDTDSGNDITRNSDIVKLAIISQEDEFVFRKDKYNVLNRTFIRANSNRPYLETYPVT